MGGSASAPYIIVPVELIVILYKESWKRKNGSRKNDITKKEFMEWTNGLKLSLRLINTFHKKK